jgi:hypothetical protein
LGNLEIASLSGIITAGNSFVVSKNLILTSGILADGGNVITVNQNLYGNTGVHSGSGEIKMVGTNNFILGIQVDSIEIASGAYITALSNFSINKDLLLNGSLNDGGNTISVYGSIIGSGNHTGTGKIQMAGTVRKIIGRPTLQNIEIASSATVTGGFDVIITGTLFMNGGNISIGTQNGSPNTATFTNNATIIRTSGNFNTVGGVVQMGTSSADLINVFINGNNLQSTNELPTSHVGNIDLTINNGYTYILKINNKYVRNLNLSDGHLTSLFDTLTRTGYSLTVNNITTVSGDFYLDSTTYDYTGNPNGPFAVGASLIIGGSGKLQFGNVDNKALYSNGLLVLRSTNSGTASVADVTNGGVNTGNKILGVATVERFISNIRNLSNNSDPTVKAWRLISMPTNHDYQTINQSWQEGGSLNSNPNPGYGTQIVSSGSSWAANGFDTVASGPSVKYFDPATNSYVGIQNTNSFMDKEKAYMVFVRGSRAKTQYAQAPDTTVLREKGTLNIGDTTFSVGTADNQFVGLPNPYPSAIDFRSSLTSATNIAPYVYLYDPRMGNYGAFVTVGTDGVATSNLSYTSGTPYLQSCQGFFVRTSGGVGSFSFTETSKVDGSAMTFRETNNTAVSSLKVNLLKNQNGIFTLSDGVLHVFDNTYNNNVNEGDALKFNNFYDNLSINNSGQLLSIEKRNLIQISDTFYYNTGLRVASYQFQFIPENIASNGIQAYLEDSYLNISMPVSLNDTSLINFTVNADAGSYASGRFRLVFRPMTTLPVNFISVAAIQKEKNVLINWTVSSEVNISEYVVEKSADGNSFKDLGNLNATGNLSNANYEFIDESPFTGFNFYRIKSISNSGETKYSNTVKVNIRNATDLSISPNPIGADRNVALNANKLNPGKYNVELYDYTGRKLFSVEWVKNKIDEKLYIQIPKTIATGNYSLCLKNAITDLCQSVLIK